MHPFEVVKLVPAPAAETKKAPPAALGKSGIAAVNTEVDAGKAVVPATSSIATPAKAAPPQVKPQKMIQKMTVTNKATTCDLCTDLSTPSCVYACPHDAAKRVDPTDFLANQIGLNDEKKSFFGRRSQRVTHHGK